jgi:hypothetical protein
MTSKLSQKLSAHLNPYELSDNSIIQPEEEPPMNVTDPISGFNKLNLIKKSSLKKYHKTIQS